VDVLRATDIVDSADVLPEADVVALGNVFLDVDAVGSVDVFLEADVIVLVEEPGTVEEAAWLDDVGAVGDFESPFSRICSD
jgi:hypothetical protein